MFSGSITTSVDIQAPPDAVWDALIAFETYPTWNPFLIEASVANGGPPHAGAKLNITAEPPGHKPAKFTPLIKACTPSQEFRWEGSLPVPGLFTGEHYFLLEAHSLGTRLVHGEDFRGLLVPILRGLLASTEQGFIAMNEALKKRVEGI